MDGRALELAIVDPFAGTLLGAIAIGEVDAGRETAAVGYWLGAPARGRGRASEAVRLLTGWAFDSLGLKRIELATDPLNTPSQAVAQRSGFSREGVLRSHIRVLHSGRRRDPVLYSLLRGELR